jgi:hypothetical protein
MMAPARARAVITVFLLGLVILRKLLKNKCKGNVFKPEKLLMLLLNKK